MLQESIERHSFSHFPEQTPKEYYGGYLFGALLPPLVVILVGGILAFLALKHVSPALIVIAANSVSQTLSVPQEHDFALPPISPLAPFFTPEVAYWREQIMEWSEEWSLDPNLIATIIQIESCGDPQAISVSGAQGLFQVMPFHFSEGEDMLDPQVNAKRGLNYLVQALEARQGDVRAALASYNGGIGAGGRPESEWSAEMRRYAYWGSGIYQQAVAGEMESATLNEWLAAGGSSLCQQASQRLGLSR